MCCCRKRTPEVIRIFSLAIFVYPQERAGEASGEGQHSVNWENSTQNDSHSSQFWYLISRIRKSKFLMFKSFIARYYCYAISCWSTHLRQWCSHLPEAQFLVEAFLVAVYLLFISLSCKIVVVHNLPYFPI